MPLYVYAASLRMTRLLVAVLGVLMLALLVLAGIWLAGELIRGVGAFLLALVGVLAALLKFLLVSAVLCGATYFVASSWRR